MCPCSTTVLQQHAQAVACRLLHLLVWAASCQNVCCSSGLASRGRASSGVYHNNLSPLCLQQERALFVSYMAAAEVQGSSFVCAGWVSRLRAWRCTLVKFAACDAVTCTSRAPLPLHCPLWIRSTAFCLVWLPLPAKQTFVCYSATQCILL